MGILAPIARMITRNWSGINDKYYPLYARAEQTAAGIDVSPDSALTNTDFLACIRVMSETIAKLPANIIERKVVKGKPERHKDIMHPLYAIFHDQPNEEMTAFTFYEMMVVDLVTWGRSYHQVVKTKDGSINSLWRFNPARMEVKRAPGGELVYIYKTADGTDKPYMKDDVLDIVGPLGGRSLVSLAKESIGLSSAAAKYGGAFFANDATAGVVLKHPATLRDKEYERLKKDYDDSQRGAANARKTLILENGMTIDRMSLPPDDAQFLQTRKFAREEIAGWCLVPPHLVGANDRSTYNTLEQQSRAAITNMALPWSRRIEIAVNNKFFLKTPYRLEFNFKMLLRGDTAAQANYLNTMIANGTISRNEARAIEDMNPQDGKGGDIYTVQMATINLEAVVDNDPFGNPQAEPTENQNANERCACGKCDNADKDLTIEQREMKYRAAVGARLRLREVWRSAIRAMALRIVKSEVTAIRKQINKQRSIENIRGIDEFKTWLDTFYKQGVKRVAQSVIPTFTAYANEVGAAAAAEIQEAIPNLDQFIQDYAENYAKSYAGSSNGQLQNMDEFEEIEQRLDEWEEGRPDKETDRQRFQLEAAAAVAVFGYYTKTWTWVTSGKNCPLCNSMSGKTASKSQPFLEKGDVLEGGDNQTPLEIFKPTFHTPLHRGCDCYIAVG